MEGGGAQGRRDPRAQGSTLAEGSAHVHPEQTHQADVGDRAPPLVFSLSWSCDLGQIMYKLMLK